MPHILFWLTIGLLLGLVVALGACHRYILPVFTRLSPCCWILLVLILALGAVLRFAWLPRQHNVFYDEFIHIDIGQRAGRDQVVAFSNYTSISKPRLKTPKWGSTYYVVQGLWYNLTAPTTENAFIINRIFGVISIVSAFFLGRVLFADPRAGLWLALLLAIYPLHLKFCTGVSLEIASVFFQTILFSVVVLYIRENTRRLFIAGLLAAAAYCLVRLDNCLIGIPLIGLITIITVKQAPDPAQRKWNLGAGMATALPILLYGFYALKKESDYHRLDTPVYLEDNLAFWFTGDLHPLFFTLLAFIGLILLYRRNRLPAVGLVCIFTAFTVFYSLFHRVDFNQADFSRFALQFAVTALIFAAYALHRGQVTKPVILPVLLSLVLVPSFFAKSDITRPFRPFLQAEVDFVQRAQNGLPQEAVLLSDAPYFNRIAQGMNTYHWSVILDADQRRQLLGSQTPIIFYRSLVTALTPQGQDTTLEKLRRIWHITPLQEKTIRMPHLRPIASDPNEKAPGPADQNTTVDAKVGFYEVVTGRR